MRKSSVKYVTAAGASIVLIIIEEKRIINQLVFVLYFSYTRITESIFSDH